ncbi:MAG: response regulator transcription factor [Chloroflexota bacterium]|nr:MAG: response regulator transcription factor [Chloroflexota bacterium]
MHVLVVDDDPLICKLVRFLLTEEGYQVTTVDSSHAAFALLENHHPDLFILDVMMPNMDGFELCKRLRSADSDAMILFLTAKSELGDRVSGLQLGADDYLVKPFEPAELVVRVKALMRRHQHFRESPHLTHLRVGNMELHAGDLKLVFNNDKGGHLVSLTPTEMKLLRCLMINAGHVVSRDVLLDTIWGYGMANGDSQVIDVYIRRLRKKIEENPSNPKFIESVRGSGYRFIGTVSK